MAYMGQGHQPQEAHAPRVSKGEESHKWKAPLGALGGRETSLGRRPPRRLDLLGPAPPPLGSLYIVGKEGLSIHAFGASLSLSNTSSSSIELGEALPEYCSSITTTPSCCCWSHLPQPLLPLAGSRRRHYADRTCVECGGAVRSVLGSSVIRITSSTTTSSPCKLPHAIYKWYVDANLLP